MSVMKDGTCMSKGRGQTQVQFIGRWFMRRPLSVIIAMNVGLLTLFVFINSEISSAQDYLKWSKDQAIKRGKDLVAKGKVKGDGFRIMSTNKSTEYQFRATWLTPTVIRAAARLRQISDRLSDQQTINLVKEADKEGQTIFLVELDAIEGAGVIPSDWQAFLNPSMQSQNLESSVKAINSPELRKLKGLSGILERDYKYDIFWMVIPLFNETGNPIIRSDASEVELIIRILGNESKAKFKIPEDIRSKIDKK